MPNRIIKESICTSEDFNALSWYEQSFFMRLIVTVDDFGRYDARPAVLKGRMFPLSAATDKNVTESLIKLSAAGIVDLYSVGGRPFLQLCAWDKHQTIRAKKSKYPAPEENEIICKQMQADVPVIQSNPYPNPNPNPSESNARFAAPSVQEVRAYCESRKNGVDPECFVNFNASKGWMLGKSRMKDWRAAVRTWERRDKLAGGDSDARGVSPRFNVETDTL